MRVALISFEYPPAVAIGGIGTYAREAACMLTHGGVDVEVFSAGRQGTTVCEKSGALVHRVPAKDRGEFASSITPDIVSQHRRKAFDVMESPEIGSEGAEAAAQLPDVARVVKLHTPTYLLRKIGYVRPTFFDHVRFSAGALRRGRISRLRLPQYDWVNDQERVFADAADEIAAPSRAIGAIAEEDWRLPTERISCFPLPFLANSELLALSPASQAKTIGFLGRLEARKGILELARAIPPILREAPDLQFRFIGPSWPYKRGNMQSWIESSFPNCHRSMAFVGPIAPAQLPEELAKCDIMVLPSRWESFGLVCPESMAAGRAVIGSAAGGMAEIIEHGKTGLLVPPKNPRAIAEAVLALVRKPVLIKQFAEAGRKSIVEKLSPSRVFPLQMNSYQRAIERCRERACREY